MGRKKWLRGGAGYVDTGAGWCGSGAVRVGGAGWAEYKLEKIGRQKMTPQNTFLCHFYYQNLLNFYSWSLYSNKFLLPYLPNPHRNQKICCGLVAGSTRPAQPAGYAV